MGFLQLMFWLIMIPWIILTIPVDLYYTLSNNVPPNWLNLILQQPWIDWTFGLMMISTLNMFLFCFAIFWVGWQMAHPILEQTKPIPAIDRLKLVKEFSKEKFLRKIHKEAKEFQKKKFR